MNHSIEYKDWVFPPDKIKNGKLYISTSLLASSLEVNTLNVVVECDDPSILEFNRNDPLNYYAKQSTPMIFRVQSINRIGPNLYSISSTSTLGLLIDNQHMGGIYTGQTAEDVISSICGAIPFAIKNNIRGVKLYGWLPIASQRDNLAQVLFAIGANIKTDLDGVLRIEGLWDGISSSVTQNIMYTGASISYSGNVTDVLITEHQYVPWTEEKLLFEGSSESGDIITFDEPMHSLTASGFTIMESGANWARLSLGSGTLYGKTYLHNTRQLSKSVSIAEKPNVKAVNDATLVSLVNSQACMDRLVDYYRCTERVNASVVYKGESPGDRMSVYHVFDKTAVSACLESADITLSNTLKANEKLLVGFVPIVSDEVSSYDAIDVIRSNSEWTVPPYVTKIRVVLIGAGQGGYAGHRGAIAIPPIMASTYYPSVVGGEGGAPGSGGSGGKIYSETIEVTPGQSFIITIGKGGKGGVFQDPIKDEDGNIIQDEFPGSFGGDSTFGSLSSANGYVSSTGFFEEIYGEIYALSGDVGIHGGSGSGQSDNGPVVLGSPVTFNGQTWYPGENYNNEYIEDSKTEGRQSGYAIAYGGFGGGAAYGANGSDGYPASDAKLVLGVSDDINIPAIGFYQPGNAIVTTYCARGGYGADALPPKKQTVIGAGGIGGNGGGGSGSHGKGSASASSGSGGVVVAMARITDKEISTGGAGSDGGEGADGAVIIYYSLPKIVPHGQLVDKNNKMVLDKYGRRVIM